MSEACEREKLNSHRTQNVVNFHNTRTSRANATNKPKSSVKVIKDSDLGLQTKYNVFNPHFSTYDDVMTKKVPTTHRSFIEGTR